MNTEPGGIWAWTNDIGRLGFTVTFSLGRDPEDVLGKYGANPGHAQYLTRAEAWADFPPSYRGTQLRAGMVGRWGFCFEEAGVEGIQTRTLAGLSEDTETISFFTAGENTSFIYLKDGQGVEGFEPGKPETLRGEEPQRFWRDTQRILERDTPSGPITPTHAVLQAITKHLRGLLDREMLEGPLLTCLLADADRAPRNAVRYDGSSPAPPRSAYSETYPGPPDGGFSRFARQARAS